MDKRQKHQISKEQLVQWYCVEDLGSHIISQRIGCSSSTILKKLHEYNIPLKPIKGRKLHYECSAELRKKRSEYATANNPNRGKRPHGKGSWVVNNNDEKFYFRSKWELLFADWLCEQGKTWQYEPKTFVLPNGLGYTPDFLVEGIWYEIKGWLSVSDKNKLHIFSQAFPEEHLKILMKPDLIALGVNIGRHAIKPINFISTTNSYQCANCGDSFIPERKKSEFCSLICSAKTNGWRRRKERIAIYCTICNKEMNVHLSQSTRKTCGSYECRYKQTWKTRKQNASIAEDTRG